MEADMNKIRQILKESRVIAVVGASTDPEKSAYTVPEYLQAQGYRVIPVNPNADGRKILGETVYPELKYVPDKVDMVQIFRPSEEVPAIAATAIEMGAKFLWMQTGISHSEAKETAESAGLLVVMDKCARINHKLLRGRGEI
jgi:O-acetylhomoserine (thiol)-lyase